MTNYSKQGTWNDEESSRISLSSGILRLNSLQAEEHISSDGKRLDDT